MDAPGDVTQLDDGLLGAPVRLVDQLAHLVEVDPSVVSASFSLAMPRRMASATSWAWVPSCRSRSMRRSVAADASTVCGPGLLERAHADRHRVGTEQDAA